MSRTRVVVDLALLTGVVIVAGLLVSSSIDWARKGIRRATVERHATRLYDAFRAYHESHGEYPNAHAVPRFERATLEPLADARRDFAPLVDLLADRRVDAYDSPDDRGPNQEFWVEMTLSGDPGVRYVVARSDDAPMAGGRWLDGVFVLRDGGCEPL